MKIIAECAINYNSMEEAKLMIKKCKELGLFAAKFQLFNEDALKGIKDPKIKEYCIERMLSFDKAKELFEYGKGIGQEVFFTPMFIEAMDWITEIGCSYIKIRYFDRYNKDICGKALDLEKELFISVDEEFRWGKNVKTLFCVPKYPAPIELYQKELSQNYKLYKGISDHTSNLELLKDCLKQDWYEYFEKHVTLTKENCLEAEWACTFEELGNILK